MPNRALKRFSHNWVYGFALAGATSPSIAWADVPPMRTSPNETYDLDTPIAWQNSLLRSMGKTFDSMVDCVNAGGSGSSRSISRTWYESASIPHSRLQISATISIADSLAQIRSSLSLQIKELAKVLGVERPTVYAWLRDEAKPHPRNKSRLFDLVKIASEWDKESAAPVGKQVRNALNQSGKSLVDLLADEVLDHAQIRSLMRELQTSTKRMPKRSIREAASKYRMDISNVKQSQAEFDVLTGKRAHEG